MIKERRAGARVWLAAAGARALAGCESTDWDAIAMGLDAAAEELSVSMAFVPAYGCDYNTNGYLVCDDTGDGYADRYADPNWDMQPAYYSGPPVRINDYGEAYQYDGYCDCWEREPSLDTFPE